MRLLSDAELARLRPAETHAFPGPIPTQVVSIDEPALVRLLADRDERARLGNAAYTRLTTRFSLDGFAASIFAAFDEAVADGIR